MSGSRYLSLAVPESGDIPATGEKKCRFPVRNRFLFFRNLPALPPKRRMETGSQRLGRIVASFQLDLSGFPGTAEKENTKVERTGMAHVLPDQNGSSPFYCRHAPLLHEPGDFVCNLYLIESKTCCCQIDPGK